MSATGSPLYYHGDAQGSTRALTDSGGQLLSTYSYDPYGNALSSGTAEANPFLWQGQYQDPQSGLYYLRARWYDPATGQFLNVDPALAITQAPYAYANDDPVNNVDPSGLFCWGVCSISNAWSDTGGKAVHGATIAAGAVAYGEGQGLSDVLYQLVPGNPAYIDTCLGFGFGVGADVCVQVTRAGHVYVAPGVGLATPGAIASVEAGYIHDRPNPCSQEVDSYLHGWTLTGGAGYAGGLSGVWGNEGSFGNNDYGDQIGVSWPGASLIQSYGFRVN